MGRFLSFLTAATKSKQRRSKPRRNTLGNSAYHRRPGFETLEVRSLLSVAPLNVALISDAVAQAQQVRAAAMPDTIAIVYRAENMTTFELVNLLDSVSAAHGGARIADLAIVAHGGPGEIDLGTVDDLSLPTLPGQAMALEELRPLLSRDAFVDLYSCSVAAGAGGETFVDEFAADTGATVFASDHPVGTVPGASFLWDYQYGNRGRDSELFSSQELDDIPGLCLGPNSHYVSESLPAGSQEPANTAFQEVVTMENTGNTTWINGPNGYTLNLTSTAQFGETGSPVYAQLNQSSVGPLSNGTFTLSLTTPSTPGTYTETWRMYSSVADGDVPFGDTVTVQIVVPQPTKSPNSHYVSESLLAGSQEPANTAFQEVVTMENTGNTTWINGPNGYTLNLTSTAQFGETGSPVYAQLNQSSVGPLSNGTFTLSLTTPSTPGTYTETWRMYSSVADGDVPFGDTVTVQIVVPQPTKSPNSHYVSESLPAGSQEPANTAFQEVVTMENTGNTTWINGPNGYTLNLTSTAQFGETGSPVYAQLNQSSVGPLSNGTFTLSLTTPSTPGTYTETWRMYSSVADGDVPFGDTVTVQIVVPQPTKSPNSHYVSESLPAGSQEPANTAFQEVVTMENTGNTTWINGPNGYTLNLTSTAQFGETGSPVYAQLNQSSVGPLSNGTFTLSLTTPSTPGTYTETWRMYSSVADGDVPFGDTVTVQIVVPQPTKSPNSHYVSESLPAGSQEPANTAFQEVVTMENTGNTTWINGPNGYTLNLTSTAQFGETGSPVYAQLNQSSVGPLSNGTFTLSLTTPSTPGTYTETWRMYSSVADGDVPFGDTVTVQIVVPQPTKSPNSHYVSESLPAGSQEPANTAFQEVVTMENTGNTTWINGPNGYTLNLTSTAQFGETGSPVYAQLNQSSVGPLSNGTFTLSLTTPSTPGTYTETWRMYSSVADGDVPFGDTVTVQIVVPQPTKSPNSHYVSESLPAGSQEPANTAFQEVVTMENTGNTTWINGPNGYTLNLTSTAQFGETGSPVYAQLNQSSVGPLSNGTFTLSLTTPSTPGTYTETWRMYSSVADGDVPFGDTVTVQIVVPQPTKSPNSHYVSESLPAGSQEPANTAFQEVVTMENTGNTTWINGPNGYTLNLTSTAQFGETGSPVYAQLNQSSVGPLSNGTFTLSLTTPSTPGTYTETWRMYSSVADGDVPFGDTVTVQIVVPQPTKSPNSHYVSESLPAGSQEPANTAFQEVVTMENTGNTTWINGPNGYTLNLTSTAQFGETGSPVYAQLNQSSVGPLSNGTFTLSLTTPSTPGTYTETWRMYSSVADGDVPFGDTVTVQIVVPQPTKSPNSHYVSESLRRAARSRPTRRSRRW